jgi:threonine synthase
MSRCLGYFSREENRKLIVLVATSGDTGGAVANGFYGVEGVEVFILYPSGKVSPVQEQQLTTLGKNIHAFEVEGSFDDCQKLVKQAFVDKELQSQLYLTSANSINVARWLPQQFYYFIAYKQWQDRSNPPVIAVPSGNFGNIAAGLLAYKTGLPVNHFVAASNANDVVPRFFLNGKYEPRKTIATISNAMDVGDPSNFVRILELFEDDLAELHKVISSYSITDDQTKEIIRKVYQETNYLMDPHGAVGFLALQNYLKEHPNENGIFLETAHPIKFNEVIEEIVKDRIELPGTLESLMKSSKSSKYIKPQFPELKERLLAGI